MGKVMTKPLDPRSLHGESYVERFMRTQNPYRIERLPLFHLASEDHVIDFGCGSGMHDTMADASRGILYRHRFLPPIYSQGGGVGPPCRICQCAP